MIINVRTYGGVFQFASRKDLAKVLPGEHEEPEAYAKGAVQAWYRSDLDGDAAEFRPVRVRHLRRGSIDWVVAAEDLADGPDDLPAKELAEAKRAEWEQREAERQAAAPATSEPLR